MIYHIIYANAARSDLREITTFLRKAAGDEIAEVMTDRILAAVESLSSRPNRQRLRKELGPGLRGLSVGNYTIFYRVLAAYPSSEFCIARAILPQRCFPAIPAGPDIAGLINAANGPDT